MSDWQAGDLAMCVYDGEWFARDSGGEVWPFVGPDAGQILTVRAVRRSVRGHLCLNFSDFPDPDLPVPAGYQARYFRKVTPPEADEFDREVIAAMTGQPQQVPA